MIHINKIELRYYVDNDGVTEIRCVGCEDWCLILLDIKGQYIPEGLCVKKDEVEDERTR